MRGAWQLGVLLALLVAPTDASAEEHATAALDYEGGATLPPTCPDRDAFASAVATRLGYDPFTGNGPSRTTLSLRYRREGKTLAVILRHGETEKRLASPAGACEELGSAAAFAAAILVDPRAMFPRPAPRAEPAPPGAPRTESSPPSPGAWPWYEPPPLPETPREPPPRETTRWHYRAGLTGTGCAGCAPLVNAGGALFVGLARERFGIDVGARADLPSTATSTGGREVSASLLLGELFPHVRLGPARLGVLGSVGTLAGESEGVRQSSLWSAVGVRAGVEWAFARPIFLRAALDGELVLGRVSLRADGVEVWSSPGLVAGLAVGLGVEL